VFLSHDVCFAAGEICQHCCMRIVQIFFAPKTMDAYVLGTGTSLRDWFSMPRGVWDRQQLPADHASSQSVFDRRGGSAPPCASPIDVTGACACCWDRKVGVQAVECGWRRQGELEGKWEGRGGKSKEGK